MTWGDVQRGDTLWFKGSSSLHLVVEEARAEGYMTVLSLMDLEDGIVRTMQVLDERELEEDPHLGAGKVRVMREGEWLP